MMAMAIFKRVWDVGFGLAQTTVERDTRELTLQCKFKCWNETA